MKEKLLEALKLKFPGVSETTLSIIVANKAGSIADEAQIASVVEALTFDQVIQSVTDHRITDANKKALENYEKKHGLKDGKPVQQQQQQQTQTHTQTNDDTPQWAKDLIKQNQELATKIAGFETKTKQQQLSEKLAARLNEKKIPVKLMAGRVLSDESELDSVFTEIEALHTEIRQSVVNETVAETVPGSSVDLSGKKQIESAVDEWHNSKQTSLETQKK